MYDNDDSFVYVVTYFGVVVVVILGVAAILTLYKIKAYKAVAAEIERKIEILEKRKKILDYNVSRIDTSDYLESALIRELGYIYPGDILIPKECALDFLSSKTPSEQWRRYKSCNYNHYNNSGVDAGGDNWVPVNFE